MARPHPSPKPAAGLGTSTAVEQAAAALSVGKFREAADLYKDLLKREPRAEWTQGLAQAYAGRAAQMAAKGMLQEAMALWRTRAQACGLPLLEGPYLDWLAQAGLLDSALPALLAAAHTGPSEQQAARQGRLAAAVLAAVPAALAQVPADSPLLQHRAAARAALVALAGGDAAALEAALQGIPFRSPYRDLRPLLKAAALLQSDTAAAAEVLARVAAQGPFELLAAPLRVAVQPAPQWLAAWQGLPAPARELVLDLKGCPPAHRPLIEQLAALPGAPAEATAALFKVLARFQTLLPRGLARRWALRLWPHMDQRRPTEFTAAFGALAKHESVQTHALAAEIRQDADDAEYHWEELANLLAGQPGQALRAALILRRLARRPLAAGVAHEGVTEWLARSLDLDPEDRGAHLDLIRALRLQAQAKPARERLEAALARWPEDTALLQQGVELALESGAFKKAAGLAKQVLRLDPLNPRVPDLIGQAHLSHARKLIKSRKAPAALRELEQAATWLRGPAGAARITLMRALLAPQGDDAGTLLRQAVAGLGGALMGGFHVALEGQRVHGNARQALRDAGHDDLRVPDAAEVLALVPALNAEPARDRAVVAALEALQSVLHRAAGAARFSADDFVQVGEALHRHRVAAATRSFMGAGRKQWPANAVLLYLDLAADHIGRPWAVPHQERLRLEQAFHAAREQGDMRMAKRLADLLNGEPDTQGRRRRPARRRPSFMDYLSDDDEADDDLCWDDVPDLENLSPARLIEVLSESLRPGELDDFRAVAKGLTPQQLKEQILAIAAQMQGADLPMPPSRGKKRR